MNRLNIDCIIQARMGSQRLPGKVLLDLTDGKKIIEFLTDQLESSNLQQKIVAIPNDETDDVLFDFLNNSKISCYRGSTFDVLDRYYNCAKQFSFKHIMRITADNPLIDPEEIDRLVEFFEKVLQAGNNSIDRLYAFNFASKMGNGYPDGFGAEILSRILLEKLANLDHELASREHVTKYIWDHPDQFMIRTFSAPKEIAYPSIKLDVDTQEDLDKIRYLCVGLDKESSAQKIINTYKKEFGL